MRSLALRALLIAMAAGTITAAPVDQPPAAAGATPRFQNVADVAGLRFTHTYPSAGSKYFVDSAPGGLAVFDYNGDGRPDIFFTNGAATPSLDKPSAAYANRLFRNDGNMRFTDVTDTAGGGGVGYAGGGGGGGDGKERGGEFFFSGGGGEH